MKKIMSFCVLAGVVCFGFVGCGGPPAEVPATEAEIEEDVDSMAGEIDPTAGLDEGGGEEAPAE